MNTGQNTKLLRKQRNNYQLIKQTMTEESNVEVEAVIEAAPEATGDPVEAVEPEVVV